MNLRKCNFLETVLNMRVFPFQHRQILQLISLQISHWRKKHIHNGGQNGQSQSSTLTHTNTHAHVHIHTNKMHTFHYFFNVVWGFSILHTPLLYLWLYFIIKNLSLNDEICKQSHKFQSGLSSRVFLSLLHNVNGMKV